MLETIRLRREKEMLREHFAAIVSHELKSPLGAVQQNLFVLAQQLEPKLNEEENERLDRMKSKIDDLIKLIHTWLRVMRVDVSKIAESFAPTDVARLVEKALDSTEPHAIRKDVELRSEVSESVGQVMADETTLVEALVNILGNAVKYTQPSTPVVVTAVREGADVTVSVKDSGVGIAPEDLPYVFDDFFRAKSGREAAGGSGLGLAITRRIVEAHGGTLGVTSELGHGSTFVMKLPAYDGTGDGSGHHGPDSSAAQSKEVGVE
jgi:signal transduction histidine kinase